MTKPLTLQRATQLDAYWGDVFRVKRFGQTYNGDGGLCESEIMDECNISEGRLKQVMKTIIKRSGDPKFEAAYQDWVARESAEENLRAVY